MIPSYTRPGMADSLYEFRVLGVVLDRWTTTICRSLSAGRWGKFPYKHDWDMIILALLPSTFDMARISPRHINLRVGFLPHRIEAIQP